MTEIKKQYTNRKTGEIVRLERQDPKSKLRMFQNILWSDKTGLFYLSDFQLKRQFSRILFFDNEKDLKLAHSNLEFVKILEECKKKVGYGTN